THREPSMLRLTDNAKAAITGITSQSGLPETGGVRLSLTTDADEVEMSLSPEPQSGDEVIEEDGARVFLEEAASTLLAEHMLDPEDADQLWGDSDPALASEAAHSTANAVIFGPSHHAEDEPQAERISRIIDAEGLDEIARLWSRSPAVTLPGALWRLYLLRA